MGCFKLKVLKTLKLGLFFIFMSIIHTHLINGKNSNHYVKIELVLTKPKTQGRIRGGKSHQ